MSKKTYVYVSSWSMKPGEKEYFGLSGYEFDPKSGKMRWIERVEKDVLFNVTIFDQKRGLLYALEETGELPGLRGGGGGRVFVFRLDPDTGRMTKIGCTETWCTNPCGLSQDQSGKYLVIAHQGSYSAATKIGQDAHGNYYPVLERDDVAVELFRINSDGTLGKLLDVDKRFGSGPEKRQVHARPHTAVRSPSGKLFAVCDKGDDTVSMYMLDEEKGKLIRPKHIYTHKPGTLPRYCVFHPEKPWFFHNDENTADFHGFIYDEEGLLLENGRYSAVDDDCTMQEKSLEQQGLVIDRAGRYIYDVVRGPNIVAVFEVNQKDGSLKMIQRRSVPGKWPRGCAISPDGRFLLVCCLGSEKVVEFAVGADGRLGEICGEYPNHAAAYATFCEM